MDKTLINAIICDGHDCVVYKRIVWSSNLSAGVLLRSSLIILEYVLYIVIVCYFNISWSKEMYKHVALAVLRYAECSKVIVHFRTRVYQTPIVHFVKKLSETCLYSITACNQSKRPMSFYIIETSKKESHSNGQSESPPQCSQMCSWQEYLLTYRHDSTWKLFRSWWWWEEYIRLGH